MLEKIKQLENEIEVKSQGLRDVLANSSDIDEIKSLTEELNKLKNELSVKKEAYELTIPVNQANIEIKSGNFDALQLCNEILSGKMGVKVPLSFGGVHLEEKTAVTTSSGFPAPKPAIDGMVFKGSNPKSALYDAVDKFRLTSVSELYYVQGTRTNNTGVGTESTAPTDNVDTYTETVLTARPFISWIPVSEAVLRSLNQGNLAVLMSDVVEMCKQKIDSQMILGNAGTASIARSLTSTVGVANTATVSSITGLAITNIDYRSAIDLAAAQIESDGDYAVVCLAHPKDAAKIRNQKDVNNTFVWSTQGSWTTYGNMRLISDANVTEGYFWVLGSMAIKLGMLENAEIEIGYNASDFSTGTKSMRCLVHAAPAIRPLSVFRLQGV